MSDKQFDAAKIAALLSALDDELQRRGVGATIFIVGGAAMALTYDASRITDDIDGVFTPRDEVLHAAAAVALAEGLHPHWLSDGVLQVMPPRSDDHARSIKIGPALTIAIASAEYVLAMKAMSSRQSAGDLADAATLCRHLRIVSEEQIAAVIARYFGTNSRLGSQELFLERIIEAI